MSFKFTPPKSSDFASPKEKNQNGFTLIELLMVFGLIAILAAITFGISSGVRNSQGRAKAKAELAMLTQALESFKADNGDFPWATGDERSSAEELFKALLGWKEFDYSNSGNPSFVDKSSSDVPENGPEPYIDLDKVNYFQASEPDEVNPDIIGSQVPDNYMLIDPWGNPYLYQYKTGPTSGWDNFGYVLYSAGPDGEFIPVGSDGILSEDVRTKEDNIDNIYAND